MPRRGRLMKPLSNKKNKLVKLVNYNGNNAHKLDKKDFKILNEMLANPDVTSLDISKRLKMPLSTVQRRRTAIERSSIVRKSYELDAKQFGWRTADLLISVEKGDCVDIANRLLTENIGIGPSSDISKTIDKADNTSPGPRVIESSLRIGDPVVNVVARMVYKSSDELFHIIQEIKKMPNIVRVEWSEIVKVVGRNNALMLTDSILK
jgi:DNA-binding Lrp family transcriptional regulator